MEWNGMKRGLRVRWCWMWITFSSSFFFSSAQWRNRHVISISSLLGRRSLFLFSPGCCSTCCVCVCVFVLVVICSRLIRLAPVRATQTVAAGSRQQQHQRERLTVRLGLHDRQTQTKGQTDGERGVPAIKSDVVLALVRTCSVCSLALFQNRSGK